MLFGAVPATVIEVIVKMGYGGTRQDAGKAIGKSGDGKGLTELSKKTNSDWSGETLAELMIDHNVGVSTIATYDLKKIDSDYFAEE
jgi:restriction endonuclease Mrr